jgi:hypothetical protein
MINVSIFLPAIRTHNWKQFYDSIKPAIGEYTYEVVFCSPFDLPPELSGTSNIKLVKDYGCPTRAAQLAALACEGEYLLHCVDDGVFYYNSIENALRLLKEYCDDKDVMNLRYRESAGYSGGELAMNFWWAWTHADLQLPGIKEEWKTSLHFIMKRNYFFELGGFDCQFEYLNHPLHDLMFRVQADGGTLLDSPTEVMNCDHMPNRTGDHGPVHDAQLIHDDPIFKLMYNNKDAAYKRIHLDFSNWRYASPLWERRFGKKIPKEYKELISG